MRWAAPARHRTSGGELFRLALKLDLTAIPSNGDGPMVTSVLGGHTPIAFSALAAVTASIKQGLLRALAVTSKTRSSVLPDVPTMAEAGFPDQENDNAHRESWRLGRHARRPSSRCSTARAPR